MLPYLHETFVSSRSAVMECSSPELLISLSDGTFIEALLQTQGRRLSKDSSPARKNSKSLSPQTPEPLPGHSRSSSVSFRVPQEDVREFSDHSDSYSVERDESKSVSTEESVVTSDFGSRQSSIRRSTNSDKLRHNVPNNSDNTNPSEGQNPVMNQTSEEETKPETSLQNLTVTRQISSKSDSNDHNGTTAGVKQTTQLGHSRQNSVSSKHKSDSPTSESRRQSLITSKQTCEKSTNTSEPLYASGWSWQGSVWSHSSGHMRRQGSFLSRRKSWRPKTFRSKSEGDRPERKDDSSSTDPRVEMVPESGGCSSAQESANQAAQEILISSPGSSKARQKKFHRHFKTVPPDEKVLNYYSCALVADILLQGHLYITRNYFAFYSNVFGYVTKLLIPTSSVLKVTKEKTAYIIPNAVGVTTEDDKHVFGSLLSRDNTYKLMVQVWNAALAPAPPPNTLSKPECLEERLSEPLEEPNQDEESSLSGSESNLESKLISNSVEPPPKGNTQTMAGIEVKSYHDMFSQTAPGTRAPFLSFVRSLPRPTLLLLISTGLLVLLFVSATVLLYRIARLHQAPDFSARSMSEVHAYINTNLEHISKVRESLEKLSFLIEHGGKYHS